MSESSDGRLSDALNAAFSETKAPAPVSIPGAPAGVDAAAAVTANRFGRYVRVSLLGRGGMGEVWKAWDADLRRWVALKLPRIESDAHLQRFRAEALAAAKLAHPNVAAVYESGAAEGRHFIAMEFIDGVTLADHPHTDRRNLVEIVRDAALAVEQAHRQRMVHRDLKPANIMIASGTGHVYVTDFGLARDFTGEAASTGLAGSPYYMAPEQAMGRAIDGRTDIWALGATLYEVLAGRPPFEGATVPLVLHRIQHEDPPAVKGAARDLSTIVLKCLEKDPARRYASCAKFAADLDRWLKGEPILAHPPTILYRLRKWVRRHRALSGAVVLGALGIAVSLLLVLPLLSASRRTVELWQKVSPLIAEAELSSRAGETAQARRRLEEGEALARAFLATGESAAARYFLARLLHEQGRRVEAVAELDRALELDAGFGEARHLRGLARVAEYLERIHRQILASASFLHVAGMEDVDPPTPEELERKDPSLASLRSLAVADLAAGAGRTSYFRESDAAYGRGCLELMRGEFDAARREFEGSLTLDSSYAPAFEGLALVAARQGRLAEASASCDRAIAIHRGLMMSYLLRAERSARRRDFAAAIRDAGEVLRIRPGDPSARLIRALSRLDSGDAAGAIEDCDAGLAHSVGDPDFLGIRARARFERGEIEGALADADAAVRARPRHAFVLFYRGRMLQERRALDRSLADYKAALELLPGNAQVMIAVGGIHLLREEWTLGLEWMEKALALDPSASEARFGRGLARFRLGDIEASLVDADAAIARVPNHVRARVLRGKIRELQGRVKEAMADYDAAVAAAPGNEEALGHRGTLRMTSGDTKGALADLNELLKLHPACAEAYVNRGLIALRAGEYDKTIADCDAALVHKPGLRQALMNRGLAREKKHDWAGALADFDAVVRSNPNDPEALFDRGVARAKLDDEAGGIEDLTRVVALQPRRTEAWLIRGAMHETLRHYREAIADYEKALEVAPEDYPRRARVLQIIEMTRRKIE